MIPSLPRTQLPILSLRDPPRSSPRHPLPPTLAAASGLGGACLSACQSTQTPPSHFLCPPPPLPALSAHRLLSMSIAPIDRRMGDRRERDREPGPGIGVSPPPPHTPSNPLGPGNGFALPSRRGGERHSHPYAACSMLALRQVSCPTMHLVPCCGTFNEF